MGDNCYTCTNVHALQNRYNGFTVVTSLCLRPKARKKRHNNHTVKTAENVQKRQMCCSLAVEGVVSALGGPGPWKTRLHPTRVVLLSSVQHAVCNGSETLLFFRCGHSQPLHQTCSPSACSSELITNDFANTTAAKTHSAIS